LTRIADLRTQRENRLDVFVEAQEAAMDIGAPDTEHEIEIAPLEEPVPTPAPADEPIREPVPA
jgi:hypothetical protein